MTDERPQLPAVTSKSALERKFAERLLRVDPGLGDQAAAIANTLADSGLPAGAVNMLFQAVYQPNDPRGRGQSTRLNWFIQTVQSRYKHRLDAIRHDYKAFRTFISEMEEADTLRTILNGEGFTISFHDAFDLWELGEDGDTVLALIGEHLQHISHAPTACVMRVKAAVKAVRDGKFTELGTALRFLNQDHFYCDQQYDDPEPPDGLTGP